MVIPTIKDDLNCSLSLLNSWLRLTTGVNFLYSDIYFHKMTIFYLFCCLCANIASLIFILLQLIHNPKSMTISNNFATKTEILNSVIDYGNWAVSSLATHVTLLLIVVRNRFPILINCFRHSIDLLTISFYFQCDVYPLLASHVSSYRYNFLNFPFFLWIITTFIFSLQKLLMISIDNSKYFQSKQLSLDHFICSFLSIIMAVHLFMFQSIQQQISRTDADYLLLQKA